MFKNHIIIAARNLLKFKTHSFINILGLTIGIACSIFIYLFVQNEFSYDRFHEKAANLYRVYITEDLPDRDPFSYVEAPAQLAGALEASFPEVERAVRLATRTDIVRLGQDKFTEKYLLADAGFFEMFTFPLLAGQPPDVLQDMSAVVLTEKTARKYFSSTDVLGRRLSIKVGDEFHDFMVAGVSENPPANSSIAFDLIIPFGNVRKYMAERQLSAWFMVSFETYVELSGPASDAGITAGLAAVVRNHYPSEDANNVTLHLQPMTDIHLNSDIPAGFQPTSDPVYSYILVGIGLLVLTIACINFAMLAFGRSTARTKEVGVRKVLGALPGQLLVQFWTEAVLMSFLALVLGLLVAEIFLPAFNGLAGKQLSLMYSGASVIFLVGLALLVGFASGSYPALVLARLQPGIIIKRQSSLRGGRLFGQSMVVLQFALSAFLVVSTFIMAGQLRYLQNKKLGFNKQQVVVLRNKAPLKESAALVERLRNQLINHEAILGVTGASNTFGAPWTLMGFRDQNNHFKQFYQQTVDYDYLRTLQIELVSGRNFSRDFGRDSSEALIVNEKLLDYFSWRDPKDKRLPGARFLPHRIIGVVKDFHFESLQREIAPLVLTLDASPLFRGINDISTTHSPRTLNFINVRIKPDNIPATMSLLQQVWKKAAGNQPFEFSFLDEDVEAQYRQEARWSKIVAHASSFAILIACLGLFGLVTLMVSKRTKEIGIRKVLGATVVNVVALLSKDFVRLVLLANLLAWPVAGFAMNKWLQNFAYRIEISWWVFALAGGLALVIALLTVSTQALRAALANPVESLRYE